MILRFYVFYQCLIFTFYCISLSTQQRLSSGHILFSLFLSDNQFVCPPNKFLYRTTLGLASKSFICSFSIQIVSIYLNFATCNNHIMKACHLLFNYKILTFYFAYYQFWYSKLSLSGGIARLQCSDTFLVLILLEKRLYFHYLRTQNIAEVALKMCEIIIGFNIFYNYPDCLRQYLH